MNRTKKNTTPLLSAIIALVCLAAMFFSAGMPMAKAQGDSFRNGEIVVGLIPGADINAFNARNGTTIREQLAGTDQYLLNLAPGVEVEAKLEEITVDPDVAFSGPNFNFKHAEVRQRSQAYIDQRSQAYIDGQSPINFFGQPSVLRLRLTEAQQITRGWGVRVAVIDTGIDFNHPLFAGRIAYPNFDFVDDDGYPQEVSGGIGYGHGTFVSGLISFAAPGATIMPLRAFSSDGSGTSFNIAKAIRFATDNGAQVINMSFGLLEKDSLIEDALSYAYGRVYMVAAAGNDNLDNLHFPAERKSKTLAVVSTDAADLKAAFSNFNRNAQVASPGVNLYSAYPGNRWAIWSGTSFSTALVTGEAALLLQLNPNLNRTAMNAIITNSGVSIDALNPAYAGKLGRVRIDYLDAVNRTLSGNYKISGK
ncbi:MAG: S8 family serine peptidase [Blastocatellales bacterium]